MKKRTPAPDGTPLDDGANIVHDRAMTGRSRLLARGAFGVTMAGLAGNLLLAVFGRSLPAQISDWPTFAGVVGLILTFAVAGLLISLRFPRNPVGWICGGLALVSSIPAGAYATYAFKLHPAGSAADYAALIDNLEFPAFLALLVFLVILFSDGRLPSHHVPASYHGQPVGEIAVAKGPGAPVTSAEAKLLGDLAAQAGLVLHNIRLTAELQTRLEERTAQAETIRASRERLVTAATAERQRLEETIRGGPEQDLAVLAAKLAAVGEVLDADAPHASATLEGLTSDFQATLGGHRHLARGVYPPLLRDQGLLAALRSGITRGGSGVAITSEGLGRYPSEVESAVYFCCLEVLRTNASVAIHFSERDGLLQFSLAGVSGGLGARERDLEDRVEALGGSFTVDGDSMSGRIPIRPAEVVA